MTRLTSHLAVTAAFVCVAMVQAQEPSARQIAQERAQADIEFPKLAETLRLERSMVVADVGAGFGAMTVVLGKWLTSGRVFATDLNPDALETVRDYVGREGLSNVTLIAGAAVTNLPAGCCDAILMRNVYHHLTEPEVFISSAIASLKRGGLLAIVDFPARPGSTVPTGVRPNRGGNGIPSALLLEEVSATELAHVQTIQHWPTGEATTGPYYLMVFRKP